MSKLLNIYTRLKNLNTPFLYTQDVSAYLNISVNHANKILTRIAASGYLVPIKRGLWIFQDQDPLILPMLLTNPLPTYISLQTALYFHGMISQIPDNIYAVSLARTKTYKTPLSTVSIHHVQPSFFFGYIEVNNNPLLKVATPEKALLDFFYLSQGKSRLFYSLPEVELPDIFKIETANKMIQQISSIKRATKVKQAFLAFLKASAKTF